MPATKRVIKANRRGYTPGGTYVMPNYTPRAFDPAVRDLQMKRAAIRQVAKTVAFITTASAARTGLIYGGTLGASYGVGYGIVKLSESKAGKKVIDRTQHRGVATARKTGNK